MEKWNSGIFAFLTKQTAQTVKIDRIPGFLFLRLTYCIKSCLVIILRACNKCLKLDSSTFPIFSRANKNVYPSLILSFNSSLRMPVYKNLSTRMSLVVIWFPMIRNSSCRDMFSSWFSFNLPKVAIFNSSHIRKVAWMGARCYSDQH